MAEAKAAETSAPASPKEKKPLLLYALVGVNTLVVAGVGFMLWKGQKKADQETSIAHIEQGVGEDDKKAEEAKKQVVAKIIPLESFVVNLSGSKGRRILKVNIELEVESDDVYAEIDKRKAQIRDIIISLLTSKDYQAVETTEGKNSLREELKSNLNNFLSTGQIKNIFFTDFIYN